MFCYYVFNECSEVVISFIIIDFLKKINYISNFMSKHFCMSKEETDINLSKFEFIIEKKLLIQYPSPPPPSNKNKFVQCLNIESKIMFYDTISDV